MPGDSLYTPASEPDYDALIGERDPLAYECRFCGETKRCYACPFCQEPYCGECMAEHGGDECMRATKGLPLHIDERGWE